LIPGKMPEGLQGWLYTTRQHAGNTAMPAFSVMVRPPCHISNPDGVFHSWVPTATPIPLHLMPEGRRTARGKINI